MDERLFDLLLSFIGVSFSCIDYWFEVLKLIMEKEAAKMLMAAAKWMRKCPGGYENN